VQVKQNNMNTIVCRRKILFYHSMFNHGVEARSTTQVNNHVQIPFPHHRLQKNHRHSVRNKYIQLDNQSTRCSLPLRPGETVVNNAHVWPQCSEDISKSPGEESTERARSGTLTRKPSRSKSMERMALMHAELPFQQILVMMPA
jgi:hypothetical protein